MNILENLEDGNKIEEIIARLLNGKRVNKIDYDIIADGIVEVKSFYIFKGKGEPGIVMINKKTHAKHKNRLCIDKIRYILVGKLKKEGYPIRLIFVLTWKEMDNFLKNCNIKTCHYTYKKRNVSRFYYYFSWVELFNVTSMRCIENTK